jgi:hypothetical protein
MIRIVCRQLLTLALLSTVAVGADATGASADPSGTAAWRQVGGGPGHAGVASGPSIFDSSNAADLEVDWSHEIESPSAPSIVGERIFVTSSRAGAGVRSRLVVLDSRTGRSLWHGVGLPAAGAVQPVVVGGFVYVGVAPAFDDAELFVFPASGCSQPRCRPIWTAAWHISGDDFGNPIGGPHVTVASGSVFALSSTDLVVFDARGCGARVCSPVWRGTLPDRQLKWGPPAVGSGSVFVSLSVDGGTQVRAFDAAGCGAPTCQSLWRAWRSEGMPQVAADVVYAQSSQAVEALAADGCDAATCEPTWLGRTFVNDVGGMAIGGGWVLVANQRLFAFRADGCPAGIECEAEWTSGYGVGGTTTISNDVAFVGSSQGLEIYRIAGCGALVCDPIATIPDTGGFAVIGPDVLVTYGSGGLTALRLPA